MTARILARSHKLEWRRVDDEVVILDLRTKLYLSLNHSGARLWPLLVAGASHQQLVDNLIEAYQIEVAMAERDVEALIAQLADADLLESPSAHLGGASES